LKIKRAIILNIIWPENVTIINNKFLRCYNVLINKAKNRQIPNDSYFEKHHIIPRSLGGDNSSDNIIKLTAKEHYLAHRFLVRFTTDNYHYKMLYALDSMGMKSRNTENRWRMPARIYEQNRKRLSEIGHSEETKQKIGKANTGKTNKYRGIPRTEETRNKISKSSKGKHFRSRSDEEKVAVSNFLKNSVWINKDGTNARILKTNLKSYLKDGWKRGRINYKKTKKQSPMSDITKEALRASTKSLIWIRNPITNEKLRVNKKKSLKYIAKGWLLGRKETTTIKERKHICIYDPKNNRNTKVKKERLQEYLDKGFIVGRIIPNNFVHKNKGKAYVNKNGEIKLVLKEEVEDYIKDGWFRGMNHLN